LASDKLEVVAGHAIEHTGPDAVHAGFALPSKATRSDDKRWRPGHRRYPIRQTTTPVPVDGGVDGGALPISAGTSFHGRRKPNGSAFHRRIMAGVQEEAKHAISAMSPLKS
jgi:hypothetical protein